MYLSDIEVLSLFDYTEYKDLHENKEAYDLLWPVYLYTVNYDGLKNLSLFEFTILKLLRINAFSDNHIAEKLCLPLPIVHNVICQLTNSNYIKNLRLTEKGQALLDGTLTDEGDNSEQSDKTYDIFFKDSNNTNSLIKNKFVVIKDAFSGNLFPFLFSENIIYESKAIFNKQNIAQVTLLDKQNNQTIQVEFTEDNFIFPQQRNLGFYSFNKESLWRITEKPPLAQDIVKLIKESKDFYPLSIITDSTSKLSFLHVIVSISETEHFGNQFSVVDPFSKKKNNLNTILTPILNQSDRNLLENIFYKLKPLGNFNKFIQEGKDRLNEFIQKNIDKIEQEENYKERYYINSYDKAEISDTYFEKIDGYLKKIQLAFWGPNDLYCDLLLLKEKFQCINIKDQLLNVNFNKIEELLGTLNKIVYLVFNNFINIFYGDNFVEWFEKVLVNETKRFNFLLDLSRYFSEKASSNEQNKFDSDQNETNKLNYTFYQLKEIKYKDFKRVSSEDCSLLFLYFIGAFFQTYSDKNISQIGEINKELSSLNLYKKGIFSLFLNYQFARNRIRHASSVTNKDGELSHVIKLMFSVFYFICYLCSLEQIKPIALQKTKEKQQYNVILEQYFSSLEEKIKNILPNPIDQQYPNDLYFNLCSVKASFANNFNFDVIQISKLLNKINNSFYFVCKNFIYQVCNKDSLSELEIILHNNEDLINFLNKIKDNLHLSFNNEVVKHLATSRYKSFDKITAKDSSILFIYFAFVLWNKSEYNSIQPTIFSSIEQELRALKLCNYDLFSLVDKYQSIKSDLGKDSSYFDNAVKLMLSVFYLTCSISRLVKVDDFYKQASDYVNNNYSLFDNEEAQIQAILMVEQKFKIDFYIDLYNKDDFTISTNNLYNFLQKILNILVQNIINNIKMSELNNLYIDETPLKDRLEAHLTSIDNGNYLTKEDRNCKLLTILKTINPNYIIKFCKQSSAKNKIKSDSLNVTMFAFLLLADEKLLVEIKQKYPSFLQLISNIISIRGHGDKEINYIEFKNYFEQIEELVRILLQYKI